MYVDYMYDYNVCNSMLTISMIINKDWNLKKAGKSNVSLSMGLSTDKEVESFLEVILVIHILTVDEARISFNDCESD